MGNYGSCVEKEIVLVTERERLSYAVRPRGESQAPGERRSGQWTRGAGGAGVWPLRTPPFGPWGHSRPYLFIVALLAWLGEHRALPLSESHTRQVSE